MQEQKTTQRFYYKSFIKPSKEYSRLTGIKESILDQVLQLHITEGLDTARLHRLLYSFDISLDRHRLRRYLQACRKWFLVLDKREKSKQGYSKEWLKTYLSPNNRHALLDKLK